VPVKFWVEDREHAPLEFGAAGHCQRRERRTRVLALPGSYCLDHLKQFTCVQRWPRAVANDVVIAGMLALDTHAMRSVPDKRVEPEDCDRELRDQLRERVESFNVRHLVNQNETPSLLGPGVSVLRKEHGRIHDSPRYRHRQTLTAKERQRTSHPKAVCETLSERKPKTIFDPRAFACELTNSPRSDRETEEHEHCTDEPKRRKDLKF
jgi:hypothetical protein